MHALSHSARRCIIGTGIGVAMLLLSACGTQSDNTADKTDDTVDAQQPSGTQSSDPDAATLRVDSTTCDISDRQTLAFEVTGLPQDGAVKVEVEYKMPNGSQWQPSQVNYSHELDAPTPTWACYADNTADNPDPVGNYRMRLTPASGGGSTNWVEWKTVR